MEEKQQSGPEASSLKLCTNACQVMSSKSTLSDSPLSRRPLTKAPPRRRFPGGRPVGELRRAGGAVERLALQQRQQGGQGEEEKLQGNLHLSGKDKELSRTVKQ